MKNTHISIAHGAVVAAVGALWYSFRRRQVVTQPASNEVGPSPMDNLKKWFANQFQGLDMNAGTIGKDSLLLVFGKIRS